MSLALSAVAAIQSADMKHTIRNRDDLRWLIGHTGGFRGGYVTDVQMSKRRLFDEESGRDVLADTTVTITIRYQLRGLVRVAKLVMSGVTDFSIFEQEGADCSSLDVIQAECTAGRLRYWFDPQGELYVVCEETQLEEISTRILETQPLTELARWTFQGQTSDGPTVEWLLAELDRAGAPCSWRAVLRERGSESIVCWGGGSHSLGGSRRSCDSDRAGDGVSIARRRRLWIGVACARHAGPPGVSVRPGRAIKSQAVCRYLFGRYDDYSRS